MLPHLSSQTPFIAHDERITGLRIGVDAHEQARHIFVRIAYERVMLLKLDVVV